MVKTTFINRNHRSLALTMVALALLATACTGPAPGAPSPTSTPASPVGAPTEGATVLPTSTVSQVAPTPMATLQPGPALPTVAPTVATPALPTVAPTVATPALPTAAPTAATPAGAPTAVPAGSPTPAAGTVCNFVRFVGDVTIPDNTVVSPGQSFAKTWRVRNEGTCAWSGYSLVFVRGEAMTTTTAVPIPDTAPGATADISVSMTAPTAPGTYTGFWDVQTANGGRFGVEFWVTVQVGGGPAAAPTLVAPTPAAGTRCNDAAFMGDITIPDGTVVQPGQTLSKTWRARNDGTCAWSGYSLAFVRGEQMTAMASAPIPDTAPGATADVNVTLTAPTTPGTYTGFWIVQTADEQRFGDEMWITVRVTGGPAAAPTLGPGSITGPEGTSVPVDTQGVRVTSVSLIPERPSFNEEIGFRVTLNNTSGTSQTYRWFVKVYQCTQVPCPADELRNSIGESTVVESLLQPGTSEVIAPQHWHVGPGVCNFIAIPHFYEPVAQGINPIPRSDGTPLGHSFSLCQ